MNYFEAFGHERFLRGYRCTLQSCWESDPSAAAERTIREMAPEVQSRARDLGYMSTTWVSAPRFPQAQIGDSHGDYIGDGLSKDPRKREMALSFLDQCIGTARLRRSSARNRLFSPWCWPVDFLGMIVVFPVRVLRRAGLPAEQESEFWVRLIQALFALLVLGVAASFGWQALPR